MPAFFVTINPGKTLLHTPKLKLIVHFAFIIHAVNHFNVFIIPYTADVHSPVVAYLAGETINLDAELPDVLPPGKRAKLVADNPVACAR